MIGNSYDAGNYGMWGRAYDPRFLFTWHRALTGRRGKWNGSDGALGSSR